MEKDSRRSLEAHISSSRSATLGIPVEEYLARADTKTILSTPILIDIPSSSGSVENNVVVVGNPASESVQVVGEPRSSKYVSELHRLCQTTPGLVPLFEIECDDRGTTWGGRLVVGDRTISRGEMRWQSKKAAKEGLAEVGVGVVKGMTKNEDGEAKNWVGMLQDYHAASISRPIYDEQTLPGLCFACTCTIPARPSTPFGSLSTPFVNKKAARTNAAREAMQFLISQDLVAIPNNNNNNNNNNASFSSSSAIDIAQKKNTETGDSGGRGGGGEMNGKLVLSKEADEFLAKDCSYTLKVLKLCSLLQISQPSYRIGPNPVAPIVNMFSGAAYFSEPSVSESHPLLEGPVGEVRNVYGKKNAKEECARMVLQVLVEIITTSSEKDLVGGG